MFGLVYVVLPVSDMPPADAIAASLARFQRGGRGDLPGDWLSWHDRTNEVEALHRTPFVFTRGEGLGIEGGDSWLLDTNVVCERMRERGLDRWEVRFCEVEPMLERFAATYVRNLERHPVTGGFGRWLNPLGHWDWWDLGDCFDGIITRQRKRRRRRVPALSSGPSRGRDVMDTLASALGVDADQRPATLDITADDNIEFVSLLAEELAADRQLRPPTDLQLPPDSATDAQRWLTTWPKIGPPAALDYLALAADVPWRRVVEAAYARFPDHWAAGVAFHF